MQAAIGQGLGYEIGLLQSAEKVYWNPVNWSMVSGLVHQNVLSNEMTWWEAMN